MASTGEAWRLGRRPALDGLRGIAVLLVVASHAQIPGIPGAGAVGVTVFFTLSGFLITSLLLEEHTDTGTIRLRRFYLRRARRLGPAMLATVAFTLLVSAVTGVHYVAPGVLAATLLYVSNWVFAPGAHLRDGLGQMWSLAIEEQFYLVWPFVLLGCARLGRRWFPRLIAAGMVASVAARLLLWDGGAGAWRVYFGTDTHADPLLIGCLLAACLHGSRVRHNRAALVAAGLAAVAVATQMIGFGVYVIVPLLGGLATAAVIYGTTQVNETSWLSSRWLTWVGRRSYGIYLWHYPIAELLRHTRLPWPVVAGIVVGSAWALAVVSWRYIEEPFLRRQG